MEESINKGVSTLGEQNISNEEEVSAEKTMQNIENVAKDISNLSRGEVLRLLGLGFLSAGLGSILAACDFKIRENLPIEPQEKGSLPIKESFPQPEAIKRPLEQEFKERGYVYIKDPVRLDPTTFAIGALGYPTAIAERFPFTKDENGETLTLRYGGEDFNEVTLLHYTGEIPPVVGEILPLMYKLPEEAKERGVTIVPYAISIGGIVGKKLNLDDGYDRYLVPIVTSGTDSGIYPNTNFNGEIINSPYTPFEVVPDRISGNRFGFFSWVILRRDGNELTVEGVAKNGESALYINPNLDSMPDEIRSVVEQK